jgi:hypothetical protein
MLFFLNMRVPNRNQDPQHFGILYYTPPLLGNDAELVAFLSLDTLACVLNKTMEWLYACDKGGGGNTEVSRRIVKFLTI